MRRLAAWLLLAGGAAPLAGQSNVVAAAAALDLAMSGDPQQGVERFVPPVPTPSSFISDARDVINAADQAGLDARIRGLQANGYGDIAVAILPSIGDYSPSQVAVAIYRAWKVGSVAQIGSARRDVGVLLLIVPKELAPDHKGQCWINTGTGAEGIITDATSGAICRDAIIPKLKEKQYAAAVAAGIDAIAARLQQDTGLAAANGDTTGARQLVTAPGASDAPDEAPSSGLPVGLLAIPGGIAALLGSIFGIRRWRRRRPRTCPKCGRTMYRLEERQDDAQLSHGQGLEEELKSVDYDVWECQCGEHLVLPYKAIFTRYSTCRQCHFRTASSSRRTLVPATTSSSGMAEDTYRCKQCGATWTVSVVLPKISESSSSSGGGGGGGGSSFGGSGSTSGGGGGGSY